jgi:hypothetical protein
MLWVSRRECNLTRRFADERQDEIRIHLNDAPIMVYSGALSREAFTHRSAHHLDASISQND